jgi:hypothetical protein
MPLTWGDARELHAPAFGRYDKNAPPALVAATGGGCFAFRDRIARVMRDGHDPHPFL